MQPDFRRNFSYQTTNELIFRFTVILYGETEQNSRGAVPVPSDPCF